MKLSVKITITVLLGLGALIALFLFESFSSNYFEKRSKFEELLTELKSEHKKLDYEVLRSAFFLYANNDEIDEKVDKISSLIDQVINSSYLDSSYKSSYSYFKLHADLYDSKKIKIKNFQVVNRIIKSSTSSMLVLQSKLFNLEASDPEEQRLYRKINNTTGKILLAKNGLDLHAVDNLKSEIEVLASYKLSSRQKQDLLDRLIMHLDIIDNNFYPYVVLLRETVDSAIEEILENGVREFAVESERELKWINYFSYLLVTLFMSSIAFITYFHLKSESEARRDQLTGLGNRKAYEEEVANTSKSLSLILMNISKFKHYNDFYGIHEGNILLTKVAERIKTMGFEGENAKYYRLGGDDFGILFESDSQVGIEVATKRVQELFTKDPITINGEDRTPIMVIASTNIPPLLENANIALKSKSDQTLVVYSEKMNLRERIRENMVMLKELKEALEDGRLVPYFQPIVDFGLGRPTKHEILARLITKDGKAKSIFPYLKIAKESRLYSELTAQIIKKSFEVIAKCKGDFSINLSIEDIDNPETVELITAELTKYSDIGNRIIFEILESEAVEKYENIQSFIGYARKHGCKFAIDDFGSGYSNFAHILNLAVDFIKIDGSLIRHLDSDPKALTIVDTIVNFAKKASIKVVAEFVHNEEIAKIVESLDINSAQGYYFYEPASRPVTYKES